MLYPNFVVLRCDPELARKLGARPPEPHAYRAIFDWRPHIVIQGTSLVWPIDPDAKRQQ